MGKGSEFQSFEKLDVWRRNRHLRIKIQKIADTLPYSEKFKLTDQLIRSSRSVTANISEGFGRFHFQENIQFCRIAKGSLYELLDHIICANDINYLSDDEYNNIRLEIIRCIQIVNGYIRYLKKAKRITNNE